MRLGQLLACLRASRALQAYLDGETDAITSRQIAEHLEQCRRCGLQADTYLAIKRALRSAGRTDDDLAVRRLRAFSRSLTEGGSATAR